MIELVFISSSRTKFAHLEYLLKDSGYFITPQRNYGIGYEEPRIYDREELLKASHADAKDRFIKSVSNHEEKFFILEDTSVVIHALSSERNEVPGLDIKYWMQDNDFDSVDALLKTKGNHRACTVRSDILLHLPKKLKDIHGVEYIVFTGYSDGYICENERVIKTSPLYPWLDNKTFNKWFVPKAYKDQNIPVSELSIDKADQHDFRKNAITKLINFLGRQDLSSYQRRYREIDLPTLFSPPTFLLLGSTCAGKSTLAEYVSKKFGYYHIEASDFMHLEYYRRHGVGSSVNIGDFAEQVLIENPKIVADKVVEFCKDIDAPFIISGFRTPIEVEIFTTSHNRHTHVVFIDTKQSIRYERCLARKRDDAAYTFDKFQKKDLQQYNMGIDLLEKNTKDRLANDLSYEDYYKSFNQIYGIDILGFPRNVKKLEDLRLENLILLALYKYNDNFFTTAQIAKIINDEFNLQTPKSKNNISRYFNQQFHPYYEIKQENSINRYRVNFTGTSHIKYIAGDLLDD